MSDAYQFLIEYTNKKDVPLDSYIIYDMKNCKIFAIKRENYISFSTLHCVKQENKHYCLDLAFSRTHTLIFDIDFKGQYSPDNIQTYITECLSPVLQFTFCKNYYFSYITCYRKYGGLHLHFPELIINHDDYILLCQQLQPHLEWKKENFSVTLDIPKNFNLAFCSKPNTPVYKIFTISFCDNGAINTLSLVDVPTFLHYFDDFKKKFKKLKKNIRTKSIIQEIVDLKTVNDILLKLNVYTMPLIFMEDLSRISFTTHIVNQTKPENLEIANFTLNEKSAYYIYKSLNINIESKNIYLNPCYKFINAKRNGIKNFVTQNYALKEWFKICERSSNLQTDIFREINELLVEDNLSFLKDPHPLKTIMEYDNNIYFLPVFYALRNHLNITTIELVDQLSKILTCADLLRKIRLINDSIIKDISKYFTCNTILYCGSNLVSKSEKFGDKLKHVVLEMKFSIVSCMTPDDMANIIIRIIDRYVPVMVAVLKNTCSSPKKYMWNIGREQWQVFTSDQEVKYIIGNIVYYIRTLIGNTNHEILTLCKYVPEKDICCKVISEASMDRVCIKMDNHKWHLKTQVGVLDLLTGHVGNIVPEFFLSDTTLGIPCKRDELLGFPTNDNVLSLYETLISKIFFRTYLKNLFLDKTECFFNTLKQTAQEFGIDTNDDIYMESMLHFYVHICKYMTFEYDLLLYFMDILSSLLISTNYARHFYILQGITGNGKSKFFEMLTKVFEGYCQSIRNVNLKSTGLCAQPELATGLFNKRIVTIEEMHGNIDENLIKEITGNSQTSFRKLYQNNEGGIPSAKLFASTNRPPSCIASEAFSARIVAIPFNSEFRTRFNKFKTSVQVTKNQYKLETSDDIVNQSYVGFFLLIYIHLLKNINFDDGHVQIRNEPEIISEFKDQYMSMTSIYTLFKQFADVQIIKGTMTTENDLISAVRQYLTETKRMGTTDQQLICKEFNEEFKMYRKTTTQDCIYSESLYNYEDEDDEGSQSKKQKMDTIVFYDGIAIKKMKKYK